MATSQPSEHGARPHAEEPERLHFAGFTLDRAGRTLTDAAGADVPLWRSEFELLLTLLRCAGRVLSRDHLLEAVAGRRSDAFDRSVDVMIGRLRGKLEADRKAPKLIVTVPGVGYKLTAKPMAVAEVAARAPPRAQPRAAERRQLTVARCDLAGPEPLSARMDPEDLHRLLAAYYACCGDIVARYGGAMAPKQPDCTIAYFGYPQAHEHAAERAVRAGLAIVEAAATMDPAPPAVFAARVAVATGGAVVGDLFGGDETAPQTAIGEAPDMSARLLGPIRAGMVVISANTRRLVGGLFRYRPLAGIDAFQVLGEGAAESRFAALHRAALSPLVGRDEEVALLLRRWARAKAGAARVVQIVGEAGLGKSRLLHELQARLVDEPHRGVLLSCSPLHSDSAYYPFIQHVRLAAGLERRMANDEGLKRLRGLLSPSAAHLGTALIADLVSIPIQDGEIPGGLGPTERRRRTAEALIAYLIGATRQEPVLLVVEDVHWIDPTSLAILEMLTERIAHCRALVVVTSRPDFSPSWPAAVPVETMVLNRLDEAAVAEFISGVAGPALAPDIARRIIARADGVPLFIEELTHAILESAASETALPASLHDSLMARLDRIPAAKSIAQIGAVIGRSFSHELIAGIADQPESKLEEALDQLVASGLVSRRGGEPRGAGADAVHTFKHALVRDAAYESLLRSQRAAIHARIVTLLERQEPGIEGAQPGLHRPS